MDSTNLLSLEMIEKEILEYSRRYDELLQIAMTEMGKMPYPSTDKYKLELEFLSQNLFNLRTIKPIVWNYERRLKELEYIDKERCRKINEVYCGIKNKTITDEDATRRIGNLLNNIEQEEKK